MVNTHSSRIFQPMITEVLKEFCPAIHPAPHPAILHASGVAILPISHLSLHSCYTPIALPILSHYSVIAIPKLSYCSPTTLPLPLDSSSALPFLSHSYSIVFHHSSHCFSIIPLKFFSVMRPVS